MFGGGVEFSADEQAEIEQINLRVLRRKDPAIGEILAQSNHVSIYGYESQIWEKRDIQGPLFLVGRSTTPASFRLLVLNKQTPLDFYLDVTPDTKFKCHDSILMLRSPCAGDGKQPSEHEVHGIWFYDLNQQQAVHARLRDAQARLRAPPAPKPSSPLSSPSFGLPPPAAAPPPSFLAGVFSNALLAQAAPLLHSLQPPVSAAQIREALLLLAADESLAARLAAVDTHHHGRYR